MHGNSSKAVHSIVSIGTGQADEPRYKKGLGRLPSYISATKASATDSEVPHQNMVEMIRNSDRHLKDGKYQRFNLPKEGGLKNMKLDAWKVKDKWRLTRKGPRRRKESTIERITRLTADFCAKAETQARIIKIAEQLVDLRRSRCNDIHKWNLWATGVRYRCTWDDCPKSQKLRASADDLTHHIRKFHNFSDETEQEKKDMLGYIKRGTCHY